jgi:hypothetical protein
VAVLLALAVFWDTERVARTIGEAYAADTIADPDKLPAVVVYSPNDLGIGGKNMAEAGAPALYMADGLRLLHRSGSRYLLIRKADEPPEFRVFVIHETPTTTLQLSR